MRLKRITYYLKVKLALLFVKGPGKQSYITNYQLVYSNLLIAFQDKYSLSKYKKLTKEIIFKKYYSAVDELLNNKKNYLGAARYYHSELLYKLNKRFPNNSILRYLSDRHEKRRLEVLNNPMLRWRYYFKYFHEYEFENFNILENSMKAGRGALVCSFHLGQFRMIAEYLNAKGYMVKLLLDKNSYDLDFKNTLDRLRVKEGIIPSNRQWEYIIAEDPTIALKILRSLQNNEIVLFYLDGNTGSGNQKSKAEVVPFFNQLLYTRRGAIQLAISNNTPIIPIVSWYRGIRPPSFKVYPEVKVADEGSNADKSITLTKSLYTFFTELIAEDPTQWSYWFRCHKYWVKKDFPLQNKVNEENEIFRKTEELIKNKKKSKVVLNKYNLSYFVGVNSKVTLVDIKSGRFFATTGLLENVIPKLFNEEMQMDVLVDEYSKKYSEKEIILSLATMKQRGYLNYN